MINFHEFWKITTYIPIIDTPLERSLESIASNGLQYVEKIKASIHSIRGVGEVGDYKEIYELDFGFEGYRPTVLAAPRYGRPGEEIILGKVAFTTYLAQTCQEEVLNQLIAAIKLVHPWEHPVIELTEVKLFMPSR